MRNEDYPEIRIRNNGKQYGRVKVNKKNVKRLNLLAAGLTVVVLTGSGFLLHEAKESVREMNQPQIDLTQYTPVERSYSIDYTIQPGDNLTSIIYAYESDSNKVYELVNKITNANKNIKNPSSLQMGDVITLYGVPESKLEEYGYTVDYDKIGPQQEIKDRLSHVYERIQSMTGSEYYNQDHVQELIISADAISAMYNTAVSSPEDEAAYMDTALEAARSLCEDPDIRNGVDFRPTAYPISETEEITYNR